jgi:phosphoglycerol transferase
MQLSLAKPQTRVAFWGDGVGLVKGFGWAGYCAATLVSCALTALTLQLWHADLHVPLTYRGDALCTQALVKGLVENGWYAQNPSLGAPGAMDMRDYPVANDLHFAIMKLLALFVHEPAMLFNAYVLLTFPLITLTAMTVFRHFGVSYTPALAASVLFSFLPYHFQRIARGHLAEAGYFLIPLLVMVALWLHGDACGQAHEPRRPALRAKKWLAAVIIGALTGTAGVYYACFGCWLFLAAGLAASLERRGWRAMAAATAIVLVVASGLIIALSPGLVHIWRDGRNPEAVQRLPQESEIYGLRLIQLLLPAPGHRLPALAHLRERYDATAPFVNENSCSSLGLVGTIGLFTVAVAFFRLGGPNTPHVSLCRGLGILLMAALFLGLTGGLGPVIAYAGFPWIRAYTRVFPYVAFCSFFGVALVLEHWSRWLSRRGLSLLVVPCAILLTALGLGDQVTPSLVPRYGDLARDWYADDRYIASIESELPPGSVIFQLPYRAFPESPPTYGLKDYDLLRPYLHARTLRWSYGAIRGRAGDRWQRRVAALNAREMVTMLRAAGFAGTCVDSAGYADGGQAVLRELSSILPPPQVDSQARLFLFRFTDNRSVAAGRR